MSEDFTLYRGAVSGPGAPGGVSLRASRYPTLDWLGRGRQPPLLLSRLGVRAGWPVCRATRPSRSPSATAFGSRATPCASTWGVILVFLGEGEPIDLWNFPEFEGDGVLRVVGPQRWPCNYFNGWRTLSTTYTVRSSTGGELMAMDWARCQTSRGVRQSTASRPTACARAMCASCTSTCRTSTIGHPGQPDRRRRDGGRSRGRRWRSGGLPRAHRRRVVRGLHHQLPASRGRRRGCCPKAGRGNAVELRHRGRGGGGRAARGGRRRGRA